MDETYLLTVEAVFQTGDNADIFPTLPADKFYFESVERIKIVKPDNQIIEIDARFVIPFITGAAQFIYEIILPNFGKEEIPVGSQVWIMNKTKEQITCTLDSTEQ